MEQAAVSSGNTLLSGASDAVHVGTPLFAQWSGGFRVQKGPIVSNVIMVDEINRAPSKVQAALLEAMDERQVRIAEEGPGGR